MMLCRVFEPLGWHEDDTLDTRLDIWNHNWKYEVVCLGEEA